jgi:hypothetical protein
MGRGSSSEEILEGRDYLQDSLTRLSGIADMPNGSEGVRSILEKAYAEAKECEDYALTELVRDTVSALSGQLHANPSSDPYAVEDIVADLLSSA